VLKKQRKVKCVCVGDAGVGKSSLLMAFATDCFLHDTVPALSRNYNITSVFNGVSYVVGLHDTQADYVDRNEGELARRQTYAAADVVILCFSAVNRNSYDNVSARWIREIKSCVPKVPIMLVCTNTDLRKEDGCASYITRKQGVALKDTIKAAGYFECSACSRTGLQELFEAAAKYPYRRKTACGSSADFGSCVIS